MRDMQVDGMMKYVEAACRTRWIAGTALALMIISGATAIACRPQPHADASMADTSAARVAITGTVAPRGAGLPAGAVVRVTVQDVSLQNAPSRLVGETTITTEGQRVPLRYAVTMPRATINPGAQYAVSARVDIDGQLAYISTATYPVLTSGHPTTQDVVVDAIP